MPDPVRVQKALADAGVASRRAADTLVAEGRVTVHGVPAVTGQRVSTHGAAVSQVLQDAQALPDNVMALAALDVCDKPDATGIVFIGRVIQALSGWQCAVRHQVLPSSFWNPATGRHRSTKFVIKTEY